MPTYVETAEQGNHAENTRIAGQLRQGLEEYYVMGVLPRAEAVQASLRVLEAVEGGSHDLTRQFNQHLGDLRQRIDDLPTLMTTAVEFGGLAALDGKMELEPIVESGNALIALVEPLMQNRRTEEAARRARQQLAALQEYLNPQALNDYLAEQVFKPMADA